MDSAEAHVAAPAAAVFAFLTNLERHWELLPGAVDVLAADRDGAVVRLRGPLGVRRTVHTDVIEVSAPLTLAGRARTARTTSAIVSWSLTPDGPRTRVRLAAHVMRASPLDRLLLLLGGRGWLRRRFAAALERLEPAVLG
ncbi:MAG TPA: SRPBCC family protein [Solirubrobacteraceae bacterium]|nr:SRPBCC family protein [Solirubrobacteraceae bacterium]